MLPLFPGYLFARGGIAQLPTVLRTPGVVTIVKNGPNRPAFLSDSFIASLRRAVEDSRVTVGAVDATVGYSVDDEVIVREGPLAGLRCVVHEVRSARRLVIWVDQIGRGVAFSIGVARVSRA